MDMGAGSSAVAARPHFPTTLSTSGMEFTRLSKSRITSKFSSIPEWGMVVGISRNEPSSSEGINSFPVPGNASDTAFQPPVLRMSIPALFKPAGIKPNILSNPCHTVRPKRITKTGTDKNFHLLFKTHFSRTG